VSHINTRRTVRYTRCRPSVCPSVCLSVVRPSVCLLIDRRNADERLWPWFVWRDDWRTCAASGARYYHHDSSLLHWSIIRQWRRPAYRTCRSSMYLQIAHATYAGPSASVVCSFTPLTQSTSQRHAHSRASHTTQSAGVAGVLMFLIDCSVSNFAASCDVIENRSTAAAVARYGTLTINRRSHRPHEQCESKNLPPGVFLNIFPNGWEFLSKILQSCLVNQTRDRGLLAKYEPYNVINDRHIHCVSKKVHPFAFRNN